MPRTPRLAPSARLLLRLRELGLTLPDGTRLVRTHAPASGRNLGAWSWCALGPDGEDLRIGSRHPMGELLAAPVLVAYEERNVRMPHLPVETSITTPDAMN